jgi:hypothetical protein
MTKPLESRNGATLKLRLKAESGFVTESTHSINLEQWTKINEVLNGVASRSETAPTDVEAIAWAYRKLQAFGVHQGTMDSALMMDRLNAILLGSANRQGEAK